MPKVVADGRALVIAQRAKGGQRGCSGNGQEGDVVRAVRRYSVSDSSKPLLVGATIFQVRRGLLLWW